MTALQFAALIITIIAGLITIGDWVRRTAKQKPLSSLSPSLQESLAVSRSAISKLLHTPHLVIDEILPIIATGIILNYFGLLLTSKMQNVLFFDMAGTAFVAFLLGPWWGAVTGLLSNSFVNFLTYPHEKIADLIIFPWSLVNMAGAMFWGYFARRQAFKFYLQTTNPSPTDHLKFLFVFGIVAAVVMSLPGAFIQLAIKDDSVFMQDSAMAREIASFSKSLFGTMATAPLLRWIPIWAAQSFWSIPDKAISAALALLLIRLSFPLFERELVHGGTNRSAPKEGPLPCFVLFLLYIPSLVVLATDEKYYFKSFWILWIVPLIASVVSAVIFTVRHKSHPADLIERADRHEHYAQARQFMRDHRAFDFTGRLRKIILLSTFIFIAGLPILSVDFYSVSLNFAFVVYACLGVVHLLLTSIAQNATLTEAISALARMRRGAVQRTLGRHQGVNDGPVAEVEIDNLPKIKRGKVRHSFEFGDQILIVASDRVTSYDLELPTPITGKGIILTKISAYWFSKLLTAHPHHLICTDPDLLPDKLKSLSAPHKSRAMLVRRLDMLPVECIVRQLLVGRAWREYLETGCVGDYQLPVGLKLGDQLPEPLFTPTSKGQPGEREISLSFSDLESLCGEALAAHLKERSVSIFSEASQICDSVGLIIADTKFEFGTRLNKDDEIELVLADELLTPDSSRFIKKEGYSPGKPLNPWDKQLIENYLLAINWNRIDPLPELPDEIVDETRRRYQEILSMLLA